MKVCCVFSIESPHQGDSNKFVVDQQFFRDIFEDLFAQETYI